MSKPVILVTAADLTPEAVQMLADYELVFAGKTPDEDSLVALSEQHQPVGIIVRYGSIPARVMDASKKLKVISKHGTGIDTIDVAAAAARGIAVKAAAGANAPAVAEHTWALIFACAKHVVQLNERVHAGFWDKATHKSLELKGKTLGLVGLGAIGQRVAAVASVMGMEVVAYDPYAKSAPEGVRLCELDELYAVSHVVSLHCPLTERNRKMINRESLAKMRDGAILVNTARGGLVDEEAAAEALKSGKLRSAGLDSFASEPIAAG
ncbi:NAD(P)-dependent oxidoreductase, partial [Noviherbaspirillum denitrificans]